MFSFSFPNFISCGTDWPQLPANTQKKINCVRFIRGGRWRLENIHLSTCWTLLRELDGRREFCFRSHASDTRVTCLTPSLAVSYFKHIHNEEEKKRAADSVSTRCRIFQVMCAGQETRSIIAIAFKQLLSTKKLTTGAINIDYVLPHRAAEAPFLCVYGGYDMASCGSCLIWNVFFFYLFFMVGFGDARFGDDFTRVDMSSRQIRQFVDSCKSALWWETKIKVNWTTIVGEKKSFILMKWRVRLDRIYVYIYTTLRFFFLSLSFDLKGKRYLKTSWTLWNNKRRKKFHK